MFHSIIEPVFQPIFSCNTRLYAYEALLRFKDHPISPGPLVERWESTGFIPAMDLAMVRRVGEVLANDGTYPRITINASIVTIENAGQEYLDALSSIAGHTSQLIVEMTETAPITDMLAVLHFCGACHELGIALALDDCSPRHPYANPKFIEATAPELVKLDGPWLQTCFEKNDTAELKTVIAIAHSHGAGVVAEFISSLPIRDFAVSLGVEYLQGYALGMPAPLPAAQRGRGNLVDSAIAPQLCSRTF